MKAQAATIPAHKPNEDTFIVDEKLQLFAVFDGIGGHAGGAAAAKIAAETIVKTFKNQNSNIGEIKDLLKNALTKACQEIVKDGKANKRPDQGTTATIVKINSGKAIIVNVGDSRCYGLTKVNQLLKLTKDHSILENLVKNRRISPEVAEKISQAKSAKELTEQGLLVFQSRNVLTAALLSGFKTKNIYFNQIEVKDFKMLILTTDGVHDNLTDAEIKNIVLKDQTPKDWAKKIVGTAFEVSGQNTLRAKPDDITTVVVKL